MRLLRIMALFLCAFLGFVAVSGAFAQNAPEKRVAVRVLSPFVTEHENGYSGFSIELWRAIEQELGWRSSFVKVENVRGQIEAVQKGEADLAISAVSITSERAAIVDFSQPMFDSGLQIMVRGGGAGTTPFDAMLAYLVSESFLQLLGLLTLLILVPLPIIWLLERSKGSDIFSSTTKRGSFFKSLWWTTTTLIGQGADKPSSIGGRVFTLFWMFVGLIFVSYFTGSVTAALTVQKLESGISGPSDLYGRKVVTVQGTTAASFLDQLGIQSRKLPDVNAAFEALEKADADAMVFDAPILAYYVATRGQGRMQLAGNVFKPESYGIVFPVGSPLRGEVNRVLLKLKETGRYQELHDRYFRAQRAR
jgi:polar amino acid transport system substrate-binding protein